MRRILRGLTGYNNVRDFAKDTPIGARELERCCGRVPISVSVSRHWRTDVGDDQGRIRPVVDRNNNILELVLEHSLVPHGIVRCCLRQSVTVAPPR